MSAPLSHRDVQAAPLVGLSRSWSAIESRVASRRAAAQDRRLEALAGLGHLPED